LSAVEDLASVLKDKDIDILNLAKADFPPIVIARRCKITGEWLGRANRMSDDALSWSFSKFLEVMFSFDQLPHDEDADFAADTPRQQITYFCCGDLVATVECSPISPFKMSTSETNNGPHRQQRARQLRQLQWNISTYRMELLSWVRELQDIIDPLCDSMEIEASKVMDSLIAQHSADDNAGSGDLDGLPPTSRLHGRRGSLRWSEKNVPQMDVTNPMVQTAMSYNQELQKAASNARKKTEMGGGGSSGGGSVDGGDPPAARAGELDSSTGSGLGTKLSEDSNDISESSAPPVLHAHSHTTGGGAFERGISNMSGGGGSSSSSSTKATGSATAAALSGNLLFVKNQLEALIDEIRDQKIAFWSMVDTVLMVQQEQKRKAEVVALSPNSGGNPPREFSVADGKRSADAATAAPAAGGVMALKPAIRNELEKGCTDAYEMRHIKVLRRELIVKSRAWKRRIKDGKAAIKLVMQERERAQQGGHKRRASHHPSSVGRMASTSSSSSSRPNSGNHMAAAVAAQSQISSSSNGSHHGGVPLGSGSGSSPVLRNGELTLDTSAEHAAAAGEDTYDDHIGGILLVPKEECPLPAAAPTAARTEHVPVDQRAEVMVNLKTAGRDDEDFMKRSLNSIFSALTDDTATGGGGGGGTMDGGAETAAPGRPPRNESLVGHPPGSPSRPPRHDSGLERTNSNLSSLSRASSFVSTKSSGGGSGGGGLSEADRTKLSMFTQKFAAVMAEIPVTKNGEFFFVEPELPSTIIAHSLFSNDHSNKLQQYVDEYILRLNKNRRGAEGGNGHTKIESVVEVKLKKGGSGTVSAAGPKDGSSDGAAGSPTRGGSTGVEGGGSLSGNRKSRSIIRRGSLALKGTVDSLKLAPKGFVSPQKGNYGGSVTTAEADRLFLETLDACQAAAAATAVTAATITDPTPTNPAKDDDRSGVTTAAEEASLRPVSGSLILTGEDLPVLRKIAGRSSSIQSTNIVDDGELPDNIMAAIASVEQRKKAKEAAKGGGGDDEAAASTFSATERIISMDGTIASNESWQTTTTASEEDPRGHLETDSFTLSSVEGMDVVLDTSLAYGKKKPSAAGQACLAVASAASCLTPANESFDGAAPSDFLHGQSQSETINRSKFTQSMGHPSSGDRPIFSDDDDFAAASKSFSGGSGLPDMSSSAGAGAPKVIDAAMREKILQKLSKTPSAQMVHNHKKEQSKIKRGLAVATANGKAAAVAGEDMASKASTPQVASSTSTTAAPTPTAASTSTSKDTTADAGTDPSPLPDPRSRTLSAEEQREALLEQMLRCTQRTNVKHKIADNSPWTTKENVSITCHSFYALQFYALRQMCCGNDMDFVRSLSVCPRWATTGGKSGASFFKTQDDRFVVKKVSKTEMQMFLEKCVDYFSYMAETFFHDVPSVLAKIVGVYNVSVTYSPQKAREKKTVDHIVVMENMFHEQSISRVFDLKGAMRLRYAKVWRKKDGRKAGGK
jgi:hypothetical protein